METKTENLVTIEGLYKMAYNAHYWTSFTPDVRAKEMVKEFESELNEDLADIPDSEKERYIDNYKKNLFHWLSAKGRCMSSMITGPAKFPVARNEKNNRYERSSYETFREWRKKALRAINRKIEESKPQSQKNMERWEKIKANMEDTMATITGIDSGEIKGCSRPLFVSSLCGLVKTLAKNGEVDLVQRCLELITNWNSICEKPVISSKNTLWSLAGLAEINREKKVDNQSAESTESEINGVRVVRNLQADRLQLFFDGKPEREMIEKLKHNAFKWSPSNGCWQRQLTNNAIYAANKILS